MTALCLKSQVLPLVSSLTLYKRLILLNSGFLLGKLRTMSFTSKSHYEDSTGYNKGSLWRHPEMSASVFLCKSEAAIFHKGYYTSGEK